ncbi:MAG: ABC transporter ATP-binding protein [Bacillota bacterium]|jgi:ABC-2 type transport system ATP-binding protein|nr:ABC transporter ATP-binding protein [Candidatus Fermentithermobacillaceae bacterium]HHT84552.1 ABC transporter ATP-binding protein [Candidatus Fermentithermobacillaceae bacterium]
MPDPRQGENNCYLQVQDLKKTFMDRKRKVEAIKGISFSVAQGEMVGFLGPNGAGKTTTIKSILGLVRPDSGRITVDGIDCAKNPGEAAKRMSAVLEGARNTYWRLTVWENMQFFAGIHGVSASKERAYFEYLLEVLGLQDKRNAEVRNLSSGYKQKTAVACALVKKTPLVFLDEPTLGLDVEASYELRAALKDLQSQEKRTIVVSSHDMKVIQDVCNRAIIISGGRIVADENIQELLSLFRTRNYRITVSRNGNMRYAESLPEEIYKLFPQADIRETHETIEIVVDFTNPFEIYELIETLRTSGVSIESISQEQVDLEKAFLEIVRREKGICG